MKRAVLRFIAGHWGLGLLALGAAVASAQQGFTVEQALSLSYATALSAAREGSRFAWVEVQEGRHNLWVGAAGEPAHALTHYTGDDGQDLQEVTWLPGGKYIAFTRGPENGNDGKPANAAHAQPPARVEVWLAESHGTGEPKLVGEGHAPLPMPDGKHVLLVRSGQIWLADLETSPHEQRAEAAQTAEGNEDASEERRGLRMRRMVFDRGAASGLTLSPDGRTLAFISRRDHNHSFLALFDLQTHALSFPAASTGNDSAPVFSPDGRQLAWLRAPWTEAPEFAANRTSPNPWSIQMLDIASGRVHTVFTPLGNQPGSVLPHMSSGEPRLLWADALPGRGPGPALIFASEADGWVHLHGISVNTSALTQPVLLTPLPGEVEDPVLSPDRKVLLYSSIGPSATCMDKTACARNIVLPENSDRRTIWALNLTQSAAASSATVFPLPLTPPSDIATRPVVAGDGTVAALVSSARVPARPALLSTTPASRGTMDLVAPAKPLHTGVPPRADSPPSFVTPQQVFFPSADKQFTLHGQLFMPAGNRSGTSENRRAALLFFHGGPHRQMLLGFPTMEYYEHAYALNQYFASRGFIVLSVNYRRGIGYGLDFREAANTGADGAAEYNDVLGAAAYLRSRPDVDPKRIGLWGGSYGGYLTALGLARNSDLFAAGVDFHGVHDWILEDNRSDWLHGTQAEQTAIAAKAHASSPMADLDKWKSPVLLIHGDNDANVAYAQTPVLADALRARNVAVEELIFPDEIHEFLLYRDWLAAYKATAEFLERHLRQP